MIAVDLGIYLCGPVRERVEKQARHVNSLINAHKEAI